MFHDKDNEIMICTAQKKLSAKKENKLWIIYNISL
jgi:hypothetical protein